MTQFEQLPKNIDNLLNKVLELKEKTLLTPPIPKIDITPYLMTHRQIAKRMILMSTGAISSAGQIAQTTAGNVQNIAGSVNSLGGNVNTNQLNNPMSNYDMQFAMNATRMLGQIVTPESAHFIVYGKFKRDAHGNLIDNEVLDPDCVLHTIAMPDTHPTMNSIKIMIIQVTKVLKMLGINLQDLVEAVAQSMIAIPASITSIASAAAILPPGAGIPVAFAAFQGLMANIMALLSKIPILSDNLEYLNYLPILCEIQKLDALLGVVNTTLVTITTTLGTIDALTKMIPSVPTPPGVGNQPGNPLTVTATANPTSIVFTPEGTDVTLSASATNGSWEYNYTWSGPDNFNVDGKNVTIVGGPIVTSTYTVTASDKKDATNKATADVTVTVT